MDTPQIPGMNRAQRRQLARQGGWRGAKSKKGVDEVTAVRVAAAAAQAAEQQAYVAKIQAAALATRDMGLLIPGQ